MAKIFNRIFWILVYFLTAASFSDAALVQLKNGNQIEGKFLGASENEVRIEISAQIVKLNVDDIFQIIFDKNAFKNLITAKSANDWKRDIMRQLKAIRSLVEGGVDYRSYNSQVNESKIKIDELVSENKSSANHSFNKYAIDAIGYYKAAAMAWNAKIVKSDDAYLSLIGNEYCKSCKPLQKVVQEDMAQDTNKFSGWMKARAEGVTISFLGVQPLWECAKDSTLKAERDRGK